MNMHTTQRVQSVGSTCWYCTRHATPTLVPGPESDLDEPVQPVPAPYAAPITAVQAEMQWPVVAVLSLLCALVHNLLQMQLALLCLVTLLLVALISLS